MKYSHYISLLISSRLFYLFSEVSNMYTFCEYRLCFYETDDNPLFFFHFQAQSPKSRDFLKLREECSDNNSK